MSVLVLASKPVLCLFSAPVFPLSNIFIVIKRFTAFRERESAERPSLPSPP